MRTEEVSLMRRSMLPLALSSAYMLAWIGVADAQFGRGSAEWMTVGGDAQRSFSIPSDPKISKAGLEKPGFRGKRPFAAPG